MHTPTSPTQLAVEKPPSNKHLPPRGLPFYGRPTPLGGQPPFHTPPGGKPPCFLVIPWSLIHHWKEVNLRLLETLYNPREYL
jgi:hypothetical protein